MKTTNHPFYFLLFFLVASLIVVFLIIKPFLSPFILAGVFAFLFQPLYGKLKNRFREHESLAAFTTTLIAIILVLIPISFLGVQIFKESSQLYNSLSDGGKSGFIAGIDSVIADVGNFLPIPESFRVDFDLYARQGLNTLLKNFGSVFSGFASITFDFFVFLAAFYFLLKDGHKLKDYFVDLSPLEDKDDELIVSRLRTAVSSVVKGSLSIGFIQGALTGVGFAIFGVPNAALWGSVAAIAALIPGIGTALVLVPAIIFLFATGDTAHGVGLLVWGLSAVGLIDNFLGPKLMGRGMQLHPLAVFISVIGGLALFGPIGLLLGPLSMSLCVALIEIYFSWRAQGVGL